MNPFQNKCSVSAAHGDLLVAVAIECCWVNQIARTDCPFSEEPDVVVGGTKITEVHRDLPSLSFITASRRDASDVFRVETLKEDPQQRANSVLREMMKCVVEPSTG